MLGLPQPSLQAALLIQNKAITVGLPVLALQVSSGSGGPITGPEQVAAT
jgi:hypothetical protein